MLGQGSQLTSSKTDSDSLWQLNSISCLSSKRSHSRTDNLTPNYQKKPTFHFPLGFLPCAKFCEHTCSQLRPELVTALVSVETNVDLAMGLNGCSRNGKYGVCVCPKSDLSRNNSVLGLYREQCAVSLCTQILHHHAGFYVCNGGSHGVGSQGPMTGTHKYTNITRSWSLLFAGTWQGMNS